MKIVYALRCALCTSLLAFVALGGTAYAQEGPGYVPAGGGAPASAAPKGFGPIAPNRPGFTNGSATIAPGDALAENGIALSRASFANGGATTLDFPETTVRVGVTPALEADISLPDYFQIQRGNRGFGDGALGVKYRFYQSRNGNTKASAAPSLSLPTKNVFSSSHLDPTLLLGIQTASGSRWSIASNLVLSNPTQNNRQIFTTAVSGSVSYTLTPALSGYVDAYNVVPREGPPASVADAGFAYLINSSVQLDAEYYVGLNKAPPVHTLAAGISFRL